MAGEQYEIYESGTAAALAEAQLALLGSKADKTGTYSTLTAGGTTPDSVTDAMLVQTGGVLSEVAQIESDLYGSTYVVTDLNTIATKLTGHSGGVQSISGGGAQISVGVLAAYDSYIFIADRDMQIYVDASSYGYYALCVGINPQDDWQERGDSNSYWYVVCDSATRYRKSQGDLPTAAQPMTVTQGTAIAVTVTAGMTPYFYVMWHNNVIKIAPPKLLVSKTESTVKLDAPTYGVTFSKIATTQGYQWNITAINGKTGNVLPAGTDVIGVLQFSGEDNFMGGVHGNEDVVTFKVYGNGAEVQDGDSCESVHVAMVSHLYDVIDPTANVVDRYVEMTFTPEGWVCQVTFKILVSATLTIAYPSGLFGFFAADANAVYTNVGTLDLTSTDSRPIQSEAFKSVTVNFADNMTVEMHSDTGEYGFVTYRPASQSFKLYFANAYHKAVSAGDFITGRCEYKF